ncbi:DUF2807 domain-containing protein [bacterium]|nr:DUF2807 domain-containing protein [bacterium]
MKNMTRFLTIGLISMVLTSCIWTSNCISPEGSTVEKTIDLPSFRKIKLSSSIEVYLTQATTQSVSIKAPQEIIDLLSKEVVADQWDIEFDECFNSQSKVAVYIALPHIEQLTVNGSGSIIGKSDFILSDLEITINGSGDVKMEMNADEVEINIKGSGDILLAGVANETDISVMGSGDVQAFKLETKESEVEIKGSGDVKVNVSESLEVGIYGSGDVQYKGNPAKTDINIKGSGEVKKVE